MDSLKLAWVLIKESVEAWRYDKASRLAAALAYHAIFALTPLLIITIAVVGLVFGERAAENEIALQLESTVGPEAAQMIQQTVNNASQPGVGSVASIIGTLLLLFGASRVFAELQGALNTIWHVDDATSEGILGVIKQRLLFFAMVFSIGGLLLLSQLSSIVLSVITNYFDLGGLVQFANLGVSFLILVLLFALIYKVLPNISIAWRDVWVGAVVTSSLFTLGKYAITLYLSYSSVGSVYGAAGSLVVLLVGIYYSAQVFLFGAEFTWVYAYTVGSLKNVVNEPQAAQAAPALEPPLPTHKQPWFAKYAAAFVAFLVGLFVSKMGRSQRPY
jgi:membrane protein